MHIDFHLRCSWCHASLFLGAVERELQAVHKHTIQSEDSTLRIHSRFGTGEIVAKYTYDTIVMELILVLSPIHPLFSPEVRHSQGEVESDVCVCVFWFLVFCLFVWCTCGGAAALGQHAQSAAVTHCFFVVLFLFLSPPPLSPQQVQCGRRIGVSASLWRSWMLQLSMFMTNQNGGILDALKTWKQNVDKKFAGMEECTVCFSIVHGSNYQLPTVVRK